MCYTQEREKICKSTGEKSRKAETKATHEPPGYVLESAGSFLNMPMTSRAPAN